MMIILDYDSENWVSVHSFILTPTNGQGRGIVEELQSLNTQEIREVKKCYQVRTTALIIAGKIYQWMLKSVDESLRWNNTGIVLKMSVYVLVAQSCLTLCDPMDSSPPGSSVHGLLQARTLEWVAIPFSRGSSPPRDRTRVSCIAGRFFTVWVTREAHQRYLSTINGCNFIVERLSRYHLTQIIKIDNASNNIYRHNVSSNYFCK